MAIFGDKKTSRQSSRQEGKKGKTAKVRHTRIKMPIDGTAHDIIRAPWFSEKALIVTDKGVYTFDISTRATKADVAGAIKEIYGVSPRQVRIVNLPAKRKTMRTRRGQGTRAARRKAYVYLNAGDTIQFA